MVRLLITDLDNTLYELGHIFFPVISRHGECLERDLTKRIKPV